MDWMKVLVVAVKQFLSGFYRILSDYYFMDISGEGIQRISGGEAILFILSLIFAFGLPLMIFVYLWRRKPKWGLFLVLIYLIPFIQVFWEGTDPRRFTPSANALFIMAALAYFNWGKIMRVAVIMVFLVISAFSLGKAYSMTSSIFKPEDYRQVSQIIRNNSDPLDAIIFHGGCNGNLTWQYYEPGKTIYSSPKFYPYNFNIYSMEPVENLLGDEYFPTVADSLLKSHPSIWLVISNSNPPRIRPLYAKWKNIYDIEECFSDQYLLLLNIKEKKP